MHPYAEYACTYYDVITLHWLDGDEVLDNVKEFKKDKCANIRLRAVPVEKN